MNEPPEPECPPDRKPHRERVADIDRILMEGLTGGICIDNTPEHRTWYLHELKKYPRLTVVYQGDLSSEIYLIKVRAGPMSKDGSTAPVL